MWQVTGQIFYGCREVLVVLKREMRTLIWCISLFVVYFRQTKLPVCSDPQEGSVAQCVEMAVHEGEAGDELMSSGWGCVRLCGSRWHIKPDHVVVVKKNSFICLWHWKERSSYLQCFIPNWGSFRMKTNTENDFKVNSLVFFNDRQLVSMSLIWVNWLKQRRIICKHINIHVSQTHIHTQNAFTVWGQHTHSLLIN